MIVQCPACRALVDVDRVELDEDKAGLRCGACGEVSWLPASTDATDGADLAERPTLKKAPRLSSTALAETARTGSEALARVDLEPLGDGPAAEAFRGLWKDSWHDETAHKKVLAIAGETGDLSVVGLGYRAVLEARPEDEHAIAGRDRVLVAAMATLSSSGGDEIDVAATRRTLNVVAVAACMALLAVAIWYLAQFFGAPTGSGDDFPLGGLGAAP